MKLTHSDYIKLAILEAKKAQNEVPVGALIVRSGEIIAQSYNKKELLNDPTAHAEMLVIKEASQKLNSWRLDDVTLYVTFEPCPMCSSAILYSRIPLVVFGAYDPLYGAMGSALDMSVYINNRPKVVGGIEESACADLLKTFFKNCRNGSKV